MMGRIYNMEAEFLYVIIGVFFFGYVLELIYMLLFLRSQKSVLRKCVAHLLAGLLSSSAYFGVSDKHVSCCKVESTVSHSD